MLFAHTAPSFARSARTLRNSVQRLRRGALALRMAPAFARLVHDPNRLTEVLNLGDAVSQNPALVEPIRAAFAATEHGARALAVRPELCLDVDALAALPAGTLGHAFARFVKAKGIDPASLRRPPPDAGPDRWFIQHVRRSHDLWHVVTGFDTDVAGELGLQAFYVAQFPARFSVLLLGAGLLNTFLFAFEDRERRMESIVRGWRMGRAAISLLGVDWNELLAEDLDAFRRRYRIAEPA